jgi:ABC-type lipoprotein release transport system permease subunit
VGQTGDAETRETGDEMIPNFTSVHRACFVRPASSDPLVLASAAVAILLLALTASAPPAFRAATIDPIQALHGE